MLRWRIEPGPGFVLLFGENGAGKTNLLEAVSMLTPGRGLRGAALSEMARQGGSGGWTVSAKLGELDIGTGTLAANARAQAGADQRCAGIGEQPFRMAVHSVVDAGDGPIVYRKRR